MRIIKFLINLTILFLIISIIDITTHYLISGSSIPILTILRDIFLFQIAHVLFKFIPVLIIFFLILLILNQMRSPKSIALIFCGSYFIFTILFYFFADSEIYYSKEKLFITMVVCVATVLLLWLIPVKSRILSGLNFFNESK
jgi:hypothetical protein